VSNNLPALVWQAPPADMAALVVTICKEHAAAVLGSSYTLEHAMAAGDALRKLQDALPHGQWLPTLKRLEEHQGGPSVRMAQNYMRLAENRVVLAVANTKQRFVFGTVRGALRLLSSSKAPPAAPQKHARRTAKASSATRFDAHAWWALASLDDRQRFVDGIGGRALAEAIPPNWNLKLVPAGESVGQLALKQRRIDELQVQLHQRDLMIGKLQRRLGPVFGVAAPATESVDRDRVHSDGDGLDIHACLRRTPAGTSSAASGTPPAAAVGSSNGGITMRSE